MADGAATDAHRRKRRSAKHAKLLSDPVEVFVLTSASQETFVADENISEELCFALEAAGCSVRFVLTSRGWFQAMRTAFWVAQRSSASRLVLVDTHPIALVVLRCLAAPRLAYLQRSAQLYCLPVLRCLHQVLLRLADDVIVLSRTSADLYHSLFCNCKSPKIIYPCVDVGSMAVEETMAIQRVLPHVSKDASMYLSYGKFKPETNFDLIIDAFEIFHRRVHWRKRAMKIKLIIAGNLDMTDQVQLNYYSYLLERLRGKKFAKDVYLVTKLNNRGKKSLLAYSMCVVFTYTSARSLLEALFVGRPILATLNEVTKEILPRRVGYILPPNARDFAKGLLFMFGDRQHAERMGHNAKDYYIQHFSFRKFAGKIKSFVEGNVNQCQKCLEFYEAKKKSSCDENSCSLCSQAN